MSIFVTDSGIGGFCILKRLIELLPQYDYIYLADNANLPYGEKKESALREIAIESFTRISRRFEVEGAVIACNTLTAAAIDCLRENFSFPIIGTEPALLPAAKAFPKGSIYLFSTSYTAVSPRLRRRFNDIIQSTRFIALPELAEMIEKGESESVISKYIKDNSRIEEKGSFPIVLGCTHYALARKVISKMYGKAEIFDGAEGAARNVCRIMKGSLADKGEKKAERAELERETDRVYIGDRLKTGVTFIQTNEFCKKSKKMSELFVQYYCKDCFFTV